MCKSACPVARRRRYASNVKQDWVKFEKEEKLVSLYDKIIIKIDFSVENNKKKYICHL